jgi:response regulator NasT
MSPPQDKGTTLRRFAARPCSDARQAALVWANRYRNAVVEADQLREALRWRPVIDQAKGILMAQRHCSADDAFDILRRLAQTTDTKLREVAQALVGDTAP